MNGSEVPDYTVESAVVATDGVGTALVRFAGGRRVKVLVPADRVSDIGITDAIETAWRNLRPLPGPDT